MIKGIGIDLIELDRIEQAINRNERFPKRILTELEYKAYLGLPNQTRQIEFLAGRFAAKEAFAKATTRGIGRLSFQDIMILPSNSGAPSIKVNGYETENIFLSISHSRDYAVAQVIIEK